MNTEAPCRLFIFLAREAPIGVVLRRGPSEWTRLSVWHTDTDTFEHGQWMRARVFERRSDVSPDGSLFVYFVRKNIAPHSLGGYHDSWAALSRPPYFTSLALWFIGGTYYTGGYFLDSQSLWLGWKVDSPDRGILPSWLRLEKEPVYSDHTNNWTDRTVYFNRLLRDGWRLTHEETYRMTWEHMHPNGGLTLVMDEAVDPTFRSYGGLYQVEYAVIDERQGEIIPLGSGTWADWDHRGRLILAQNGRLLHWSPDGSITELEDFNPQTPDPQPSPKWAQDWPTRSPGV